MTDLNTAIGILVDNAYKNARPGEDPPGWDLDHMIALKATPKFSKAAWSMLTRGKPVKEPCPVCSNTLVLSPKGRLASTAFADYTQAVVSNEILGQTPCPCELWSLLFLGRRTTVDRITQAHLDFGTHRLFALGRIAQAVRVARRGLRYTNVNIDTADTARGVDPVRHRLLHRVYRYLRRNLPYTVCEDRRIKITYVLNEQVGQYLKGERVYPPKECSISWTLRKKGELGSISICPGQRLMRLAVKGEAVAVDPTTGQRYLVLDKQVIDGEIHAVVLRPGPGKHWENPTLTRGAIIDSGGKIKEWSEEARG